MSFGVSYREVWKLRVWEIGCACLSRYNPVKSQKDVVYFLFILWYSAIPFMEALVEQIYYQIVHEFIINISNFDDWITTINDRWSNWIWQEKKIQ